MTMKDSLSNLFRERFQGHEAPVDPAAWQVIEARLLTAPPASDSVNELFRERFHEHEVDVDPSVWQGISSQLGHGAAGGGLLGGYGWVAAGVAGVVAIGALVIALNSGKGDSAVAQEETAPPTLTEQSAAIDVAEPTIAEGVAPDQSANQLGRSPGTGDNRNGMAPMILAAKSTEEGGGSEIQPATSAPDQPTAGDTDPHLVELIITDLSEQVKKEVETGQGSKPNTSDPARTSGSGEQEPAGQTAAVNAEEPPVKLIMPNVFTPNGDGTNDTYRIEPKNGFSSTLVRVYSMKTNQLVYSSAGLDEEWTGANCEDGMYMVAVEAITLDGRVVSEGRVVWLNRNSMN